MRVKWILAFLSAVVLLPVLLIALALLFLHFADLGKHRDAIALQLSSLAGRSITLDGEIDIDLSMTPSLLVTDIAVANAAWGSEPQMLTVQRVEAQIDLLPLLSGETHIPRLHVSGVSSLLETDKDGTGNWVFVESGKEVAAEPDEAPPAGFKLPWLGDLNIADVGVVYRNAQSGQRVDARLEHARVGADSPESPMAFDIVGDVIGEPVEIRGTIAVPAVVTAGSMDFPLELYARVLDLNVQASGAITGTAESPAVSFNVEADAADLDKLREAFGDVVPQVQPVKLVIQVDGKQGQPVSVNVDANAGKAVIATRLTLKRDGPRPELSGNIAVTDLDIARLWAPLLEDKTAEPPVSSTHSKPSIAQQFEQPLTFDWLDTSDVDIAFSLQRINLPQIHVRNLQHRVIIEDRLLTIGDLNLETDAGSVSAGLRLNNRGREPEVALEIDTTAIVLAKLKPLEGIQRLVDSTAEADIAIKARGATPAAMIGSLDAEAQLNYRDPKHKDRLSLKLMHQPDRKTGRSLLVVDSSGQFEGHAIELSGHITPPQNPAISDEPYKVDLKLQALGIAGRATGAVPGTLYGAELDIEAQADNLDRLRQAFGQAVPKVGRTELTTRLTVQQSELKLSKFQARLGDAGIKGWLTLNTSQPVPDLKADLSFTDLDLDKLMPSDSKTTAAKTAEKPASNRVFSDEPLPFDALSRANVLATLRATNLVTNNRRIKQAEININLTDRKLSASLLKMASVQGELLGVVVIDASGSADPSVVIKLKAERIDLGELLASLEGKPPIEGPLATDIHLQGRGESIAQIMASLDGKVHLLIEQGSADAKALDLFVGGLSAMFGTIFTADSSKTRINCAICDLKFEKGTMNTQLAVLDTQYSTVFLEGNVDLQSEQLDLKVSPEAKGVTLSVAFPVLVKGQLARPNVDVEKKGALIKTGELWATVAYPPAALLKFDDLVGDGKQNPCVSMVTEKAGIPFLEDVGKVVKGTVKATGKVVEGTAEGTEKVIKGVGGVLKDTGSGLGKLFKESDGAESPQTDAEDVEDDDDFDMDF